MMAPVLIGLVGGVVDLVVFNNHRAELQDTADVAALAAAKEAGLKGWTAETAKEVVAAVVESNLSNKFSGAEFGFNIVVDEPNRRIAVTVTQDHYGYFWLGYFTPSPQISVEASARATGQAMICIIVQSPKKADAFELSGDSTVTASGCSAYANSTSTKALTAKDNSHLSTQLACTAGGFSGKPSNFSPTPLTDCPAISDPLAERAKVIDAFVAVSNCDQNKVRLKGGQQTLSPGTYCGGLEIDKACGSAIQSWNLRHHGWEAQAEGRFHNSG